LMNIGKVFNQEPAIRVVLFKNHPNRNSF